MSMLPVPIDTLMMTSLLICRTPATLLSGKQGALE